MTSIVERTTISDSAMLWPERSFAEFFAGIGLMRMGLEQAGWSIKFANDIDEQKYSMYKGHFGGEAHFVLGDVHELSAADVPTVALMTASFPCNDLSLAGTRRGLNGKQSSALWGFTRIVKEMGMRRPPLILLENVVGFLTANKGEDFRRTLLMLNHLGYSVDVFILNAAYFVPQSRERLFIVAKQESSFGRQQSSWLPESEVRPKALIKTILGNPDICWSVKELPPLPQRSVALKSILDDLPDDAPEWWSTQRAEYLLNQMSPRHREKAEAMIAEEGWAYGTVFRRMRNDKSTAELRTDGIAGCLRTPRGGSAKQILFKAGKGSYQVRLITPTEAARLMGAEEFHISGSIDQALFGFGDAVCVPVIKWIANNYLNPCFSELTTTRLLTLTPQEIGL